MTHIPARRSIFGPSLSRSAVILKFPSGRPKDHSDTEARIALAKAQLKSQFGYSDADAALIVDDFVSGNYGVWDAAITELMR